MDRDSFGDSSISGDLRWAGSYGVNIDFVARSHCAAEVILVEDMEVSACAISLIFNQPED
jgi:hypothetical protein